MIQESKIRTKTENEMRRYRPVQPPLLQGTGSDDLYSYREYLPGKSLANYVVCYWTSQFRGQGQSTPLLHRVIPDGCVDIIFDLGARSFRRGAFVSGLMTSYEVMPLAEPQSMFGIRFFVEEADRFFRCPVAEISAGHVWLEDIWGSEALWVMEGLLEAADTAQRIAWVEQLLMQQLRCDGTRQNALLLTSMQHMYEHQGNLSVASLAEKVCYSERNVRRMFQQALGIGPKELARIIQFQSLLQLLARGQAASLADAAVQCGYYDQSHVSKSFRAYYGETPGGIFAVRGARAQKGQVVRFLHAND